MAMKRVFKRLNVVKVTESPLKAANYLEAVYEEITPKTQSEKQTKQKTKSSRNKAMTPKEKAVDSDGAAGEAKDLIESEQ